MVRKPESSRITAFIVRVFVVVLIGFVTVGTAIMDLGKLWTPQGDDGIDFNKMASSVPSRQARLRPRPE